MYLAKSRRLVFENPIELEDYRVKLQFETMEALYKVNLPYTEAGILAYQKAYYVHWRDEFETYVQVQYRWRLDPGYPRLAWISALMYQMVYAQPSYTSFLK
jgi:hypothetical protein